MTSMRILSAAVKYNIQKETAYFGNLVFTAFQMVLYSSIFILFYRVLFTKTTSIGGYNGDQILLMMLMMQAAYYIYFTLFDGFFMSIAQGVNDGKLDYALLRPRSSLLLLWSQNISIANLPLSIMSLALVAANIDFDNLQLVSSQHVLIGIMIFCMGLVARYSFLFSVCCTAFWTGNSTQAFITTYALARLNLPYESIARPVRWLLYYIAPMLLGSGLGVAVMTGHVGAASGLSVALVVTALQVLLATWIWRRGLASYTSASS